MTHNKDFRSNEERVNQTPSENNIQEQADLNANESQSQQLKIILVGPPEAVRNAINNFYLIDEAQVDDWSPFQKSPSNPEEVMSILFCKTMIQ